MKKVILKTLDILLTIVMIASAIYAVFNMVMSFLPAEIQQTVYDALHMSSEYIATFSVSATINAAVLVATKIAQTYSRIKLTAQLTKAEEVNTNTVMANETVVERTNAAINNLNVIQGLIGALLSIQKVNAERNIKASDKLVYKEEKEAYKQALEEIETAKAKLAEINNVATVYEKTEVKEIIVEKEQDNLSGRV